MKAAAVAAFHGIDPMALLALEQDDFLIAMAVVLETDRLWIERIKARDTALAQNTAAHTIRLLSKAMK